MGELFPYQFGNEFWSQLIVDSILASALLIVVIRQTRGNQTESQRRGLLETLVASIFIVVSGFVFQSVLFTSETLPPIVIVSVALGTLPGMLLGFLVCATGAGRTVSGAAWAGVLVLVSTDLFRWAEPFVSNNFGHTNFFNLLTSLASDVWGGPIAGVACRWAALRTGAVAKAIEPATYAEPNSQDDMLVALPETPTIRIDRTMFLTGVIGLFWLWISWLPALLIVALLFGTLYFGAAQSQSAWFYESYIIAPILLLVVLAIRQIARGTLRGHKLSAFIGVCLMLGEGWLFAGLVVDGCCDAVPDPRNFLSMLSALVFGALLGFSFRDSRFWTRNR
jgi:hypothetical protein